MVCAFFALTSDNETGPELTEEIISLVYNVLLH